MRVAARIRQRGVGHGAASRLASARRSARLARSMRATSAAGMMYSSWSRQANTTNVAKAPIAPTATIHQMCQIKAKPITVAKNAQTKPVGELRGISIARYSGFSSDPVCSAGRFLNCQKASSPDTTGRKAKLNAGGGEEVAHSSE